MAKFESLEVVICFNSQVLGWNYVTSNGDLHARSGSLWNKNDDDDNDDDDDDNDDDDDDDDDDVGMICIYQ